MNIKQVIDELRSIEYQHNKEVLSLRNAGNELNVYNDLIIEWAKERGLDKTSPNIQLNKLMEEIGELANGINKNKHAQIVDSIGDVFVVMVIMCKQLDISLSDCVATAWSEIKNRKGKLIGGRL